MKETKDLTQKDLSRVPVTLQVKGRNDFSIQLEKLQTDQLIDQSDDVLDQKGQGCITNPGGPGC